MSPEKKEESEMKPKAALTTSKSNKGSMKYSSPNQNIPPGCGESYGGKSTKNHGGSTQSGKVA